MPLLGTFAGASTRAYGLQAGIKQIDGLELITSQSFSSVSSVTFDNCFSNNYVQYKIVTAATGSTLAGINLQFRASGSTYTTASYRYQKLAYLNNATNAARTTGATNWQNALGAIDNGIAYAMNLEILNPYQTMYTSGVNQHQYSNSSAYEIRSFGITVTNSFDGFIATTSGGTMTGNIYVYGFSKGA